MKIKRFVSEDLIKDFFNRNLTLVDFINQSKVDNGYNWGEWYTTPIEISIPDLKKEGEK